MMDMVIGQQPENNKMQTYRAGLSALLSFLSIDFWKDKAYKNCQYCIVAIIHSDMRENDLD